MSVTKENETVETPIPLDEQICSCGHPASRHVSNGLKVEGGNNAIWCYELFCSCSKYYFNHNL